MYENISLKMTWATRLRRRRPPPSADSCRHTLVDGQSQTPHDQDD
jgi:hypothetical protein